MNIFGGIMKCDIIANGIVAASRELGLKLPLVVRLEGDQRRARPQDPRQSGLAIEAASTMADGAQKVVAAVAA